MAILKNIIFDLGGVLLNVDYHKTANAFTNLGVQNFKTMYDQFSADELFEKLETGSVTKEQFFEAMISRDPSLTAMSITKAWNAMLLEFRLDSLRLLEELGKKYGLYLLSNTNIIHKASFDEHFTRLNGKNSLDEYFSKAYYSHQVGLRKPNVDIFHYLLEDAGIRAEETLFIDDSFNNIEGARNVGMRTHLLLANERVENLKVFI